MRQFQGHRGVLCAPLCSFFRRRPGTPGKPAAKDVELKPEWFEGLNPGTCTVLKPDSAFVEKNLTKAGVTERRVAVVIGNGTYQNAQWNLPNPRNDAAGISRPRNR